MEHWAGQNRPDGALGRLAARAKEGIRGANVACRSGQDGQPVRG